MARLGQVAGTYFLRVYFRGKVVVVQHTLGTSKATVNTNNIRLPENHDFSDLLNL